MEFSERLINLRLQKQVSQKDIAEFINASVRQYQRYEKGEQQPTLPIVERLADFFNVSIDFLVGRSNDPSIFYPVISPLTDEESTTPEAL